MVLPWENVPLSRRCSYRGLTGGVAQPLDGRRDVPALRVPRLGTDGEQEGACGCKSRGLVDWGGGNGGSGRGGFVASRKCRAGDRCAAEDRRSASCWLTTLLPPMMGLRGASATFDMPIDTTWVGGSNNLRERY